MQYLIAVTQCSKVIYNNGFSVLSWNTIHETECSNQSVISCLKRSEMLLHGGSSANGAIGCRIDPSSLHVISYI